MVRRLPGPGSLRWTPVLLLLFALGALGAALGWTEPSVLLVVPLGLLAINLVAAIFSQPAFRAQPGLLMFHVALLAAVLLAGLGRMTYLKGWVELARGEKFLGELTGVEQGVWHWGELNRVTFVNDGFVKTYGPNWRPRSTQNRVQWRDHQEVWRSSMIGDDVALLLHGYRFYTSNNHGFALIFVWTPLDGSPPVKGMVHLPSFPRYRDQSNFWTIPGTDLTFLVLLSFAEQPLDPATAGVFPVFPKHSLKITVRGESRDLTPGERFIVPGGGELLYEELTSWMGYRVFYDWTSSWLLAAFLVGVLSLSWHFWRKFSSHSIHE